VRSPGREQVIDQGVTLALAQQPETVLEELCPRRATRALARRPLEGGGCGCAGDIVVGGQSLQRVAVDAEPAGEPDRGLQAGERGDDAAG
jgi:hypothetical protein